MYLRTVLSDAIHSALQVDGARGSTALQLYGPRGSSAVHMDTARGSGSIQMESARGSATSMFTRMSLQRVLHPPAC